MPMDNQFIIVISHKSGSGGHETAELLAKKLGVKLYSKDLADEMIFAGKLSYCVDENGFITVPQKNSGEPSSKLKRGAVLGTFACIRERAEAGESFVVLESCADYYLSDFDCVTRVFLSADDNWRIQHISAAEKISEKEAKKLIHHTDHNRKAFHNHYCKTHWGTEECYDFVIDTTGKTANDISEKIITLVNIL